MQATFDGLYERSKANAMTSVNLYDTDFKTFFDTTTYTGIFCQVFKIIIFDMEL